MLFQDFSAHLSESECDNFKMSGSHKLGEISFWKWFKITTLLKALSFLAKVHKLNCLVQVASHVAYLIFCLQISVFLYAC